MPGQPSRDTQASNASHKMPKLGDVRSRIYMGLPLVQPTASALDRVYAEQYGAHNYDRPWDECEARGVTARQLEAELVELDQKYQTYQKYQCKW